MRRDQLKILEVGNFTPEQLALIEMAWSTPSPGALRQRLWRQKGVSRDSVSRDSVSRDANPSPVTSPETQMDIYNNFSLSSSKPLKKEKPVVVARDQPEVFPTKENIEDVFEGWDELAEQCGLPKIRIKDGERRKLVTARLKELGSIEAMGEVMTKVRDSPFCRGEVEGSKWRATFDWFIKKSSIKKILEGNYDQKAQEPTADRRDNWRTNGSGVRHHY